MVPGAFTNFFIASASAGAALLGLLFVSISISPEEKITADAHIERRISAYGALTLLVNAFFISLAALLPGNFGLPVTIFAAISFFITLQNGIELLRPHEDASKLLYRLTITLANLATYAAQGYYGILLLRNSQDSSPVYALTTLLLVIYVLGVFRAWQLLGGKRPARKLHLLTPQLHPTSGDDPASTISD